MSLTLAPFGDRLHEGVRVGGFGDYRSIKSELKLG